MTHEKYIYLWKKIFCTYQKKKNFAYQKTILDTFQVREGDSNLVRLHWKNQDVSFDIKAIGTYKIYFFLKRRC